MPGLREARSSAAEALREFRWFEYRPFAWIMAVQVLFLLLASNLGTSWGMAGAGWLMRLTREAGVHYPSSFVVLPLAFSYLESLLFTTLGSFLIPLSLVRILAPMDGSTGRGAKAIGRAAAAIPATFLSLFLNVAALLAWQWIYPRGPGRWIHHNLAGFAADLVGWLVSILVSFMVAAILIYVPVRAVSRGSRFSDAFPGGVREGLGSFGPTLFIMLAFAWPALILLAPVQLLTVAIVSKFRPEVVAVLLGAAAVLSSLVNYCIYSAVARFHRLGEPEEE